MYENANGTQVNLDPRRRNFVFEVRVPCWPHDWSSASNPSPGKKFNFARRTASGILPTDGNNTSLNNRKYRWDFALPSRNTASEGVVLCFAHHVFTVG